MLRVLSLLHIQDTPLHLAAAMGHDDTVDFLLRAGADPDSLDSRYESPLVRAAAADREHIVMPLLAATDASDLEACDSATGRYVAWSFSFG